MIEVTAVLMSSWQAHASSILGCGDAVGAVIGSTEQVYGHAVYATAGDVRKPTPPEIEALVSLRGSKTPGRNRPITKEAQMADPYIDQFETLIYGKFAVEQMSEVMLGRIAALDGAVHFCIGDWLCPGATRRVASEELDLSRTVIEEARSLKSPTKGASASNTLNSPLCPVRHRKKTD